MMEYRRYAIYYAPPAGEFARRAAGWLGWDLAGGHAVRQPDLPGLPRPLPLMTVDPRRYGFHGTIKAPFRLAEGATCAMLQEALDRLAGRRPPVVLDGMHLVRLKGFLAFVPFGDETDLVNLAADVVRDIDGCRAPLTPEDISRRRPDRLSLRQRQLLEEWGYPHVMEEFRFHLTLSDNLPEDQAALLAPVAAGWFADCLPRPFRIDDLSLCGEDGDGRFSLISRHALTG